LIELGDQKARKYCVLCARVSVWCLPYVLL